MRGRWLFSNPVTNEHFRTQEIIMEDIVSAKDSEEATLLYAVALDVLLCYVYGVQLWRIENSPACEKVRQF